jgi:hypothetical protein
MSERTMQYFGKSQARDLHSFFFFFFFFVVTLLHWVRQCNNIMGRKIKYKYMPYFSIQRRREFFDTAVGHLEETEADDYPASILQLGQPHYSLWFILVVHLL